MRADRTLIGPFIEEALRLQSPTKVDFRLARKSTALGGVPVKAGTVIMLCLGAANRDHRKFANPNEFRLDRKNVREHIAFGRGIHTCAGAPLARLKGRVTINRMLDRMADIQISEAKHGPLGQLIRAEKGSDANDSGTHRRTRVSQLLRPAAQQGAGRSRGAIRTSGVWPLGRCVRPLCAEATGRAPSGRQKRGPGSLILIPFGQLA